jgi:uridine monophosphate synthetase
MINTFFDRLAERAKKIDSLLCIGLDPRVPDDLDQDSAMGVIVQQNKDLIAATKELALAYKPNIAFYEAWGEAGLMALRSTLGFIPEDIPIILDAKRGDIGATSEAYAKAAFEQWGADAVTVAPYMGSDSVKPFLNNDGKAVFVLCKTSNPGASDFQELMVHEAGTRNEPVPLYVQTARTALTWGDQIGLVVAANDGEALRAIRQEFPDTWLLAPGIGAQGGSIYDAVAAGLSAEGSGILLVIARSIANAPDPALAANNALLEFRAARDRVLNNRRLHGKNPVSNRQKSGPQVDASVAGLRHELLKGLVETGCFKTGDFILKSGLHSPFYIDLRRVISDVRILRIAGRAYAALIRDLREKRGLKFDRIAGIPIAALPLASATSLETGIPMIFPRIQQKDHGTGNLIEGEFKAGERVLLLDDLITTGKSKIEAIEILRNAGLEVKHLVVLIERGKAGRRDMDREKVELYSFADIEDFLPVCRAMGVLNDDIDIAVQKFLADEGQK